MSLLEMDIPVRKVNRIRALRSTKLVRFPLKPRGHRRDGWRDPKTARLTWRVNERAVIESEG